MRLSEIKNKISVDVIRDDRFGSLGLITYKNPDLLIYIEDAKYLPALKDKKNISCVLTAPGLSKDIPERFGLCLSKEPKRTFYDIQNYLVKETNFYWKPFKTRIAKSAKINSTAFIAKRNVRIGERCQIGPHVSILEGTIIENDVVIRAGCVISTEGFQMKKFGTDVMAVAHGGGVLIHDRVELQANCCISKSVFGGFTEIGEDSKFDNMVHIAHNVKMGKRCFAAACAMIAGSVTIGDDVWIGPAAAITSEVDIGDKASITVGSVVSRNVAPGQKVTGNFAIDHDRFIEFIKSIR
jgi:UDP-3-O-[3-hydroxymyristoyl] glucosamine N-acyltransferase